MKLLALSAAVAVSAVFSASAATVAYWPLAKDNGVRLAKGDTLANSVPGGAGAVTVMIRNRDGAVDATSASGHPTAWPMGANAFPDAFGVYDPVAKANLAAATGVEFGGSFSDYWNSDYSCPWEAGALKVADFDAGKTESFTVEFFVKPDANYKGRRQVLAAMPLSTSTHANYAKDTEKASWAIRLDIDGYIYSEICTNTEKKVVTPTRASVNIWDDRWHHIAMRVDGTTYKLFVDYEVVRTATLSDTVKFSEDGHLFIGGTTHTIYSYAGSMAHFRISNEALSTENFLHFTRTVRVADEPEDVVFHLDFEPVEELSTNRFVAFNRAATGSAVHVHGSDEYYIAELAKLDADVYANTIYAARTGYKGVANAHSFSRTGTPASKTYPGQQFYPYILWYPADDIFHDYAFTVEMFLKTSETGDYRPYLRRHGGTEKPTSSNIQFTIGTGKTPWKLVSGNFNNRVTAGNTINDGQWHHIALVYDKTEKKQYLYSDWEQTGNAVTINESASNFITASAHPITILGDAGDNSGSIAKIDDVRITKRALGWKEFITPTHVKNGMMVIVR